MSNNIAIAPSTFTRLAAHPNIVGCKLSHANLSHHSIIASHPTVAGLGTSKFAVFTGLGQQLLPVLSVGGVGAIDGLAGMFPRTVVRLWNLYMKGSGKGEEEDKKEMKSLQYEIAQGEEVIGKFGTVGVKEGVSKALGMGLRDATRLPMMGGMPAGAWGEFEEAFERLKRIEEGLGNEK